ncbi:MAG: barstar family protein [Terracidiphilus sp.]
MKRRWRVEGALSALTNLGYQRLAAEKAIEQAIAKDAALAGDFDGLFRGALKVIRSGRFQMAWQVAIVVDDETDISQLLGMMPVWAKSTAARRASAGKLRNDWEKLWHPEPVLTLFRLEFPVDPITVFPELLTTLEDHHPILSCLRLFGMQPSQSLKERMARSEYHSVERSSYPGLGFVRELSSLREIPELILDAEGWTRKDDVYNAFFAAVRSPNWHGRNRDALNDSISTGGINEVELPYRLVVHNATRAGAGARSMLALFKELVDDIHAEGCPVEMKIVD